MNFLALIPRSVWIALAVLALVGLGVFAHQRSVKAYGEERYAAGVADEKARAQEAARKQAEKDEKTVRKLKEQHREEIDRISRDADALRLRGPGKARCRPAPIAASGRDEGHGEPDVAGPEVPPDDRAAVPWGWLVQRAEQFDANRAEVLAWREWHRKLNR